jgi:ABC-type branched-subunit amino acid transport system ATPase component
MFNIWLADMALSRHYMMLHLRWKAAKHLHLSALMALEKQRLVMSIAGHVIPESGHVILDNENITEIPSHIRARRGIGLVPEGRRVFP